ncbi:MAG: hypothetical protein ACRD3W_26800, partial [Terriglobales bacterium]
AQDGVNVTKPSDANPQVQLTFESAPGDPPIVYMFDAQTGNLFVGGQLILPGTAINLGWNPASSTESSSLTNFIFSVDMGSQVQAQVNDLLAMADEVRAVIAQIASGQLRASAIDSVRQSFSNAIGAAVALQSSVGDDDLADQLIEAMGQANSVFQDIDNAPSTQAQAA